jgi:ketosteroid isomerase-like protein
MELQEIADELAIQKLVARYADAVSRRDEKAWGATWAEDGEWLLGGRTSKGRAAVVETWKTLMASLSFVVQTASGGLVEVAGDRGTGRWYVREYGKRADGAGSLILGVYHDDYVRAPEGWVFARRRFDFLYMGPNDLSGAAMPFPEQV